MQISVNEYQRLLSFCEHCKDQFKRFLNDGKILFSYDAIM